MNTTERAIAAYFVCLMIGGATVIVAVAELVDIVFG